MMSEAWHSDVPMSIAALVPPWLVRAFNIDAAARIAEWAADGIIAPLPCDECEAAWVDIGGES